MQTIKLKSHVGDDGILHLDVPTDIKNAELELVYDLILVTHNIDEFSRVEGLCYEDWEVV